jgi:hypothetical protein
MTFQIEIPMQKLKVTKRAATFKVRLLFSQAALPLSPRPNNQPSKNTNLRFPIMEKRGQCARI